MKNLRKLAKIAVVAVSAATWATAAAAGTTPVAGQTTTLKPMAAKRLNPKLIHMTPIAPKLSVALPELTILECHVETSHGAPEIYDTIIDMTADASGVLQLDRAWELLSDACVYHSGKHTASQPSIVINPSNRISISGGMVGTQVQSNALISVDGSVLYPQDPYFSPRTPPSTFAGPNGPQDCFRIAAYQDADPTRWIVAPRAVPQSCT